MLRLLKHTITNINRYQLLISKSFGQTGFDAKPLRTKWQYRAIPLIGIINNLIKRHKAETVLLLEAQGITGDEIDCYPILHAEEDPCKAISVRALNKFCSEIMKNEEIAEHFVTANKRGMEQITDINHKQANMLQSNFDHHASVCGNLTPDEIAYMRGKKPITTASQHYRESLTYRGQLNIAVKLEDWAGQIFNHEIPGVLSHHFGRLTTMTISPKPKSKPTEISMDISSAEYSDGYLELHISNNHGADIYIDQVKEVK